MSWDISKDVVVYRDGRYTLGQKDRRAYMIADGEHYDLGCHPYEPCLYITKTGSYTTTVHNAFDPVNVLESFSRGETIQSITGRRYTAGDFCRMVEFAAGMNEIGMDVAEEVFGLDWREEPRTKTAKGKGFSGDATVPPSAERVISDDPVYAVIREYPDSAVEYCLVRNEPGVVGENAHRDALVQASRVLFFDGEDQIWRCDCGKAQGKPVDVREFLAAASEERGVNYRGAFLYPPCGVRYTDADFDRVNAALFPNGTDALEVYEWTTDWSEFFEDGHEWWGALCFTVYDRSLDRFAVLMASATD